MNRSLREVVIIDVGIPGDDRVKTKYKELEKLEKYQQSKGLAHAKSHCGACCYWGPFLRST